MAERDGGLLNRRELARGAMVGGASLVLGTAAWAGGGPAGGAAAGAHGLVDATTLGAVGDGKADSTAALQRALDGAGKTGGGVFLPPGIYVTGELKMRPGVALVGVPAWNYSGAGGGTVLRLASGAASCLLNMTDGRGATLEGLALDGGGLGKDVHGIFVDRTVFAKHEDSFRIERCQVANFTGDAARLMCVWCFSIRHSMFAFCHGDGLSVHGWDGFLLDNWLSGNKRAGFAARLDNAAITFTGNRIEWNEEENMVVVGGNGYQITGNFFDRAGTFGLALRKGRVGCSQVTITGNYFRRSGKLADAASQESGQILLDGARGVTCVGNNFEAGRDDGGAGTFTPAYGIVTKGLENCVIANNVLHRGAMKQLLLDLGEHGEGVVVKDNPGSLFEAKQA